MFKFTLEPQIVQKVATKYRQISTKIPVPESLKVIESLALNESRSMHGAMPIIWDRAKDFQIFDRWGNVWIDFTSTIFVANAGHANPRIKEALVKMINQDLLHAYNYPTEIRAKFLEKLVAITPKQFEKAYLMSAGTEATECLVKLIRMNGRKIGKKKPGVISFSGAYHGRTIGAAMIGGTPQSQEWIGYKDPHVYQIPFPYEWNVTGKAEDLFYEHMNLLEQEGVNFKTDICGFVLESYIGWSAAFIPKGYIQALASFAKANDILLSFDEIQGGFGRTGKLFVYEHYGVPPDLIACGKGISSSLPLSAVLGSREIMDLPEVGSMSSTHSANPLTCAAGLANLEVLIDENLIEESCKKGQLLHKRLNDIKEKSEGYIKHIAGEGLLAALIFENPKTGEPEKLLPSLVCEEALRSGLLLVHTGRESIKIAPPLTIPEDALLEGVSVLEGIILSEIRKHKSQNAA
jgi:4-aminobutyrate aminotransferase-like enzyme